MKILKKRYFTLLSQQHSLLNNDIHRSSSFPLPQDINSEYFKLVSERKKELFSEVSSLVDKLDKEILCNILEKCKEKADEVVNDYMKAVYQALKIATTGSLNNKPVNKFVKVFLQSNYDNINIFDTAVFSQEIVKKLLEYDIITEEEATNQKTVEYIHDSLYLCWKLTLSEPSFDIIFKKRNFDATIHERLAKADENNNEILYYIFPALLQGDYVHAKAKVNT